MAVDRKRGRPKGTGINDHEMLLKIAALLSADPAKKRTTAIKEIGVTNASVVRRLRDKYQIEEMHLMAELAAAAAPVATPAPAKTGRKAAAAVAAPAVNGHASAQAAAPVVVAAPATTPKKGKAAAGHAHTTVATPVAPAHVPVEPIVAAAQPAPVQAAAPQATAPSAKATAAPAAQAKPAVDPLAALFEGLNIETLVTQFIGHALGLSAAEIKNSPIPALIRQQAQLADLVLPLLASQFMGQKQTAKVA